ncbi:MAG TPA: hypothetical protein VFL47_10740 [Flavisolibacter sp.]|nr:hypothetical protein [Flavisolibacter sp.]
MQPSTFFVKGNLIRQPPVVFCRNIASAPKAAVHLSEDFSACKPFKSILLEKLVLFFGSIKRANFAFMSQEIRSNNGGERDINRMANECGQRRNYEGFEGMNYEQIRQPYNPKSIKGSRSKEDRKERKRPDEG